MYYQRSRRKYRNNQNAAERTKSADFSRLTDAEVEQVLSEIRKAKVSAENCDMRSRSTSRPPPPPSTPPPPLPEQGGPSHAMRARSTSRPPPPPSTPPPPLPAGYPQTRDRSNSRPPPPPSTPPPPLPTSCGSGFRSRSNSRPPPPPPATPPPPLPETTSSFLERKSKSIGDSLHLCEESISSTSESLSKHDDHDNISKAKQHDASDYFWTDNPIWNSSVKSVSNPSTKESSTSSEWSDSVKDEDAAKNETFELDENAKWTNNPTYSSPSNRKISSIETPSSSVPSSPSVRRKFKIKIQENDKHYKNEVKVDEETAKLVENLKVRLKTLDDDLERVKSAALKIHQELNTSDTEEGDEYHQKKHSVKQVEKRPSSFVYNNQNQHPSTLWNKTNSIQVDLRMPASKEWYDPGSLLSLCICIFWHKAYEGGGAFHNEGHSP